MVHLAEDVPNVKKKINKKITLYILIGNLMMYRL